MVNAHPEALDPADPDQDFNVVDVFVDITAMQCSLNCIIIDKL